MSQHRDHNRQPCTLHKMIVSVSVNLETLTIRWLFVDHLLTICWPFVDYLLTICWPFVDHSLTIPWPFLDPLLTISWLFVDHFLTIRWPFVDHLLTICWPFVDHLLTICWPVQQARKKEQLIFHVRRHGPRHQICCRWWCWSDFFPRTREEGGDN